MKTKFMKAGATIRVLNLDEDALTDKLAPGVYSVAQAQFIGFYLNILKDQLEVPGRIYGGTMARVQKCLDTYKDRTASTGILLTGDKGTGKTLLMSILANKAITDLNLPVVLVKDAYAGDDFAQFIESIGECVLVFDEFGKMYTAEGRHGNNENDVPQKALLSMMDGVDKTKRMFILTENSEFDISEFMLNRPSRIFYHFKYRKLDEASVIGYCIDKKVAKEASQDIIDLARRSKIFSFDMLQSIVEEQLRFNVPVATVVADLNIDTREDRGEMIEILRVMDRATNEPREMFDSAIVAKPGQGYNYVKVKNKVIKGVTVGASAAPKLTSSGATAEEAVTDISLEDQYEEIYIRDSDLAYEKEGQLVYETEDFIFVAKRVEQARTDYWKLF